MNEIYKNNGIKWNSVDADNIYDLMQIEMRERLKKHAQLASMGSFVTSSDDKNIIGTMALDTCYGIVFYDRYNKFGMVGHGSPTTKFITLISMLKALGNEERTIEYVIVPGYRVIERGEYTEIMQFSNYLKEHCPSNIKLIPFKSDLDLRVKDWCYEFSFDVKTSKSVSADLFYERSDINGKYFR